MLDSEGFTDIDGTIRYFNQVLHHFMTRTTDPGTGFYDEEGKVDFDERGRALIPRNNKIPALITAETNKLNGEV